MSGARIHKTATPFNASELREVDYVQAFDVVYWAHLNHDPTKLVRSGHTSWAFTILTFGPSIGIPAGVGGTATVANDDSENATTDAWAYFPQPRSYVVTAIDDETGQESRASAEVTLTNDLSLKRNYNTVTWGVVANANRYRIYAADNEQDFGWVGDTDALTFRDDYLMPDLTDGPPEGFNPFTLLGNPSTVTFFEQRLAWARMKNSPNALAFSRSADFENMDHSRPTRADDSVVSRIAAQKVNSVNALVPMERLLALTGNGVFIIVGSNDDYISANPPPRAVRQSGRGASRLKPIVTDEVVFFSPAIGSGVRTLGFTFEIDGYRSNDVSIFSSGFFEGFDILSWSYAEDPLSVIWAARDDGKMPAFTWQQEQQVWGWTLCETDGLVLDVCTVQEQDESRNYLIVRRTVNGVVKTFLERMASAKWEDQADACYLDCAVTFLVDTPQQAFYVPHLAGATNVQALADGFAIKGLTVDALGLVDLGYAVQRVVHIGLGYECLIETLPLMVQGSGGEIANRKQQTGHIVVQVTDTRIGGLEIGRRLLSDAGVSKMYPVKARRDEALGKATALFTGMRTVDTEPVLSGETTAILRHNDPTPFTLTAVYIEPIVTEK